MPPDCYLTMDEIGKLGVGHVGGCLSAIDALVVLYYNHMRIDPQNPRMSNRDRFVLSKDMQDQRCTQYLPTKAFPPFMAGYPEPRRYQATQPCRYEPDAGGRHDHRLPVRGFLCGGNGHRLKDVRTMPLFIQ